TPGGPGFGRPPTWRHPLSASPPLTPDSNYNPALADLGWDDDWAAVFATLAPPGAMPARVARTDRGVCTVLCPGPIRVTSGRHPVATGDWVVVGPGPLRDDLPVVTGILPRRSAFVREQAGRE